jgi:hypothetical protein
MLSNFEDMILLRRENLIARKDFPHPLYLMELVSQEFDRHQDRSIKAEVNHKICSIARGMTASSWRVA